jgi:hypothetical protein
MLMPLFWVKLMIGELVKEMLDQLPPSLVNGNPD